MAHVAGETSLDFLRSVAERAALAGGEVVRRGSADTEAGTKSGPGDYVTDVDRDSERAIGEVLVTAAPEIPMLGEEEGGRPGERYWVVDPLDGTTNFAHGFPAFCVSIGLEAEGRIVLGVVYDPLRQELFEAEAGKGAFLNGERIHVSKAATLDKALVVTGFAYDQAGRQSNLTHFSRFALRAQGLRRTGSAAIDLCYAAAGRVDGFWELYLHPWDVAAGSLIVTEAGGRITDFAGKAFSIYGKETLASNGLVHQAMLEVLAEN